MPRGGRSIPPGDRVGPSKPPGRPKGVGDKAEPASRLGKTLAERDTMRRWMFSALLLTLLAGSAIGCAGSQEARKDKGEPREVEAECPKCGAQFKVMTWKGL